MLEWDLFYTDSFNRDIIKRLIKLQQPMRSAEMPKVKPKYRRKPSKGTYSSRISIANTEAIWRCPDGIAWRLCLVVVEKQLWFLRQCLREKPFLCGSMLVSLLIYCTYIIYQTDYIPTVDFSVLQLNGSLERAWEHGPRGVNEWSSDKRIGKGSILLKKLLEGENNKVEPGNVSRASAALPGIWNIAKFTRLPGASNQKPVTKVRAVVFSETPLDLPILAQALSLHPRIKYIHEPLSLLGLDHLEEERGGEEGRKLVTLALSCDLLRMYNSVGKRWYSVHDVQNGGSPGSNEKYFRLTYQHVFCYGDDHVGRSTPRGCPEEARYQQDLCRHKPHHVVRVAHLRHLKHLEPELLDSGIKVLHVVQDPRTVMAQRMRKDTESEVSRNHVRDTWFYCNEIQRDVHFVRNTLTAGETLKQRGLYRLIRYEDLQVEPLDRMLDIYKFLDIQVSGRDVITLRSRARALAEETLGEGLALWRILTSDHVQQIQTGCQETMDLLGYRPVEGWTTAGVDPLDQVNLDINPHFAV